MTIRKRQYPFHLHECSFNDFVDFVQEEERKKSKKHSKDNDPLKSAKQESYRKASKKLIKRMAEYIDEAGEIQVGKTMCLYRAKQSRPMELLRLNAVNSYVVFERGPREQSYPSNITVITHEFENFLIISLKYYEYYSLNNQMLRNT